MSVLILSDGTKFYGESFGAKVDSDGEVVFNTGMSGYPESLTDPSYRGQILTFTYPLIGNYGIPSAELNQWGFSENFESESIHVKGVITAQVSDSASHFTSVSTIQNWLEHHGIPGITGIDTRALTKKLREHGVMLGKILQQDPDEILDNDEEKNQKPKTKFQVSDIEDPNLRNLVAEVSCKDVKTYEPSAESQSESESKTIIAYDCGIKNNILRSFLKRGVRVHRVPWNYNLATSTLKYDALFISNGPGDPKLCTDTIAQIKWALEKNIPTFGICLGNQLLSLAIGGDTYKLKYGHRGCNQPCVEHNLEGNETDKCIITSQNHGFAVDDTSLPDNWKVWFTNANDGTVDGIRHISKPFFSVQFHPESAPGPEDADYLFDEFLGVIA